MRQTIPHAVRPGYNMQHFASTFDGVVRSDKVGADRQRPGWKLYGEDILLVVVRAACFAVAEFAHCVAGASWVAREPDNEIGVLRLIGLWRVVGCGASAGEDGNGPGALQSAADCEAHIL